MSRPTKVPSYRLHRQSGLAVVTITEPSGRRKDVMLGRYGTPESRAEYARVIAEWEANYRRLPLRRYAGHDLTIIELMLRFWMHVEQHYRHDDGTPTSEVENYRYSLRPLKTLYGHTIAAEFGPLALKAVRNAMVDAGLARNLVNQRVGRIKRMFKWAVSEELIPPVVFHGLQTLAGLQRGRSAAKEREPIKPVDAADIDAVIPLVNRFVRGMIRLQWLTGMRPSEVCNIRRADIDTSGRVWLYTPIKHKTAWRGKQRIIGIGPHGQEILKEFFTSNLDDFFFSPRRAMEELRAAQRQRRKSKVQPSQLGRRKKAPKKQPREHYDRHSYFQAIRNACRKADVGCWHPNQLRHSYATRSAVAPSQFQSSARVLRTSCSPESSAMSFSTNS
jgi:integrase